jgi:ABC-type microcin C transport system permease subunit YejB
VIDHIGQLTDAEHITAILEHEKLTVAVVVFINTIMDMYLMAIPLPVRMSPDCGHELKNSTKVKIMYRVKLNLRKKISLLVLFSGG